MHSRLAFIEAAPLVVVVGAVAVFIFASAAAWFVGFFLGKLGGYIPVVGGYLEAAADAVGGWLEGVANGAAQAAQSALADIFNIAREAFEALQGAIEGTYERAKGEVTYLYTTHLPQLLDRAYEGAASIADNATAAVRRDLEPEIRDLESVAGTVSSELGRAQHAITDTIPKEISAGIDQSEGFALREGQRMLQEGETFTTDALAPVWPQLQSLTHGLGEVIGTDLPALEGKVKTLTEDATVKLPGEIAEAANAAAVLVLATRERMETLVQGAETAAKGLVHDAEHLGSEAVLQAEREASRIVARAEGLATAAVAEAEREAATAVHEATMVIEGEVTKGFAEVKSLVGTEVAVLGTAAAAIGAIVAGLVKDKEECTDPLCETKHNLEHEWELLQNIGLAGAWALIAEQFFQDPRQAANMLTTGISTAAEPILALANDALGF
jgi:hypothetical protein